jgi:hypothetical protein
VKKGKYIFKGALLNFEFTQSLQHSNRPHSALKSQTSGFRVLSALADSLQEEAVVEKVGVLVVRA